MTDQDPGFPNPEAEVYRDRPILLTRDGVGAVLYGMEEYVAGGGNPPAVDDEIVLSVLGPQSYSWADGERVENPRKPYLDGVFKIVDVKDGDISSPFFTKQDGSEGTFWGVDVVKVRDISTEEEIDRVEKAGLISMI